MTITVLEAIWYIICLSVLAYLLYRISKELNEEQQGLKLQYNYVLFRLDFIMKSFGIYEDFLKELDKQQGSMPWEIEDKEKK